MKRYIISIGIVLDIVSITNSNFSFQSYSEFCFYKNFPLVKKNSNKYTNDSKSSLYDGCRPKWTFVDENTLKELGKKESFNTFFLIDPLKF